jgi:hypothetical protein
MGIRGRRPDPYGLLRIMQPTLLRRGGALYEDYVRVFCPRTIGKDKAGTEIVEAFQYGSGCPGGLPLGGKWCSFRVGDIDWIFTNGDEWRTGTSDGKRNGWIMDIDVAT